jgi:hypothetical protein
LEAQGVVVRIGNVIVSGVLGLAGLGLVGAGVFGAPAAQPFTAAVPLATVGLRALPSLSGELTMQVAPTPVEKPKPAEVDAGTSPVDAGTKSAVAGKPDAGAKTQGQPDKAPPPVPVGEASLNLQASDTADIYLDGKKLGTSPQLGVKVKVGAHKVRFDCYDAAGNTQAGAVKIVTVTVDQELDVPFQCPEAQ